MSLLQVEVDRPLVGAAAVDVLPVVVAVAEDVAVGVVVEVVVEAAVEVAVAAN